MLEPLNIADKWKKLSGDTNWEGLLEPLDMDLRKYIIHYGEMAQATYDCFISEPWSKHAGNCLYSKDNFFSKVDLEKSSPFKYKVTKYFTATSSVELPEGFLVRSLSKEAWSKESNWIGYVAVATDEGKVLMGRRDIVIAWRGTVQAMEWAIDFQFNQVSAHHMLGNDACRDPMVHHGWLSLYTSPEAHSSLNKSGARNQILEEVARLVELYKEDEVSITVTGHSLGGAMATLNAVDIATNGFNKVKSDLGKSCIMVTAIVFGSPRVGNSSFQQLCSNQPDLRVLRVRNKLDIVPHCPFMGFSEVGQELLIDTTKSEYLKLPGNLRNWHNLEGYLHGVAGTQGSKNPFELVIPRSIALVNKSMDGLKDEYLVPPNWKVLKDKGMKQMDDGTWVLGDYQASH